MMRAVRTERHNVSSQSLDRERLVVEACAYRGLIEVEVAVGKSDTGFGDPRCSKLWFTMSKLEFLARRTYMLVLTDYAFLRSQWRGDADRGRLTSEGFDGVKWIAFLLLPSRHGRFLVLRQAGQPLPVLELPL